MAMTIMNDASVAMSLGELNKNISMLGKRLKKVSSGQRINGAGDAAAEYAISEKMRVRIRSLDQDVKNVQNGSSLLRIADGGIASILGELRNLKELALNAANDTNTDIDRATIQKEFEHRKANIDDIATETNYNGKPLLDGTYELRQVMEAMSMGGSMEIVPIEDTPFNHTSVKKIVSEPPSNAASTNTVSPNLIEINGDGEYEIPNGFSGTIKVNAANVKLKQADSSTTLSNVTIEGPPGGNANLWIENLNIASSTNASAIKFQGSGNVLNIKGTNNNIDITSQDNAGINIGGGLQVQGDGSSSLKINNNKYGAGIGSDSGESLTGNIEIVDAKIDVASSVSAKAGASIGSGADSASVGNITVENSNVSSLSPGAYHAAIGAGSDSSSAGDILVVKTKFTATCVDTGIGSGYPYATCGDITIHDSDLTITNQLSACVGAGDKSECGDIYVSATKLTSSSDVGAGIGSGQNQSKAGDITILNGSEITHVSPKGAAIGSGANGIVEKIYISESAKENLHAENAYSDETHLIPGIGRGEGGSAENPDGKIVYNAVPGLYTGKPLVIHHGTRANEAINVYISNMHTNALKEKIPSEEDIEYLSKLSTEKAFEYQKVLDKAMDKTLEDAKVTTRDDAAVAIRLVEGAIQYTLEQATSIGAYISRLEYMESNLVTANENTVASDSTLRDADMAKEMAEYTKSNILSQASQAMLAQANQSASSVLSLLQ